MKNIHHLFHDWISRVERFAGLVTRYRKYVHGIIIFLALSLGYWGWWMVQPPTDMQGYLDNFYLTVQLVTLQFPKDHGHVPWPLQAARLLVPLVTVVGSFHVLVGSITRPMRIALLPHARKHIVLCGSKTLTEAALIALTKRQHRIVIVAKPSDAAHLDIRGGHGITIVEGDPLRGEIFKSLNLKNAAALFLTFDDDVVNLNLAMLAMAAINERPADLPPLVLAVLIQREDLAMELDAALDGLSRGHGVRYHRLCPDREGLRLELARFAPVQLKGDVTVQSHVLLAGLAGNWQQIAAQIIVAAQDHPEKRPVLTFAVDEKEAEAVQRWRVERPELDLVVEIEVLTRPEDELLPSGEAVASWRAARPGLHLAIVLREDADAIAAMLALRRPSNAFGAEDVPILVHQSKEDRLLSRLGETQVRNRDLTRLVAFGGLVRAESIERVFDRVGDEMAMALHAHYLADAKTLGINTPAAHQAWDDMPENLREANRAGADHASVLFAAADLEIAQAEPGAEQVNLSPDELEYLSRVEHRLWMADRIVRGWRYAAERDDRLLLHPCLIHWNELSDSEREKDRNAVKALVAILANMGRVIVRKRGGASHADQLP